MSKKIKNDTAISLSGLGKYFRTYTNTRDIAIEWLTGKRKHNKKWAFRDITLDIKKGEVIGVLGKNGAGKSTLLKVITGVLEFNEGNLEINGKVSSILELGTGFLPQLTGRQNIYMGGLLIGLSKEEIDKKFDWIVDFAELRSFIDKPFFTYSSGMRARLTFATAVSIDPEIFIVDEALAAGDSAFTQKSLRRIREICSRGVTALFVSHSTFQIMQLCNRCIWLDEGKIKMDGDPVEVARAYEAHMHAKASGGKAIELFSNKPNLRDDVVPGASDSMPVFRAGPFLIERVEFINCDNIKTNNFKFWETMKIRTFYRLNGTPPADETLGVAFSIIRKNDFVKVATFNTVQPHSDEEMENYNNVEYRGEGGVSGYLEVVMEPIQINPGEYYVSVGLLPNIPGSPNFYELHHLGYQITVTRDGFPEAGVFYPQVGWKHVVNEPKSKN